MAEQSMTILRSGRLVRDKSGKYYFHDNGEGGYGQYFVLRMIRRQDVAGNEAELGAAVDAMNDALAVIAANVPGEQVYLCTLGCVPAQANKLVENNWAGILAPKTRFFLYDSRSKLGVGDKTVGFGEMYPDFIWISDEEVYTVWDPEGLAHRYKPYSEIDGEQPGSGTYGGGQTGGDLPGTSGEIKEIKVYHSAICPHCGQDIFRKYD